MGGKNITEECHTVRNAAIPAEVITEVEKDSVRKLVWKLILLITFSINAQENQEITLCCRIPCEEPKSLH